MPQVKNILTATRQLDPRAAAFIFALAYIAGLAGSVAALLIVGALLAGLYGARVVATAPPIVPPPFRDVVLAPSQELLAAPVASSPLADAIASGLQIKSVQFSLPATARAKKTAV